jgi:hypothetical protein
MNIYILQARTQRGDTEAEMLYNELLDTPIIAIGDDENAGWVRTCNILEEKLGAIYVRDLLEHSEERIMGLANVGDIIFAEISRRLKLIGCYKPTKKELDLELVRIKACQNESSTR